MRLRKVHLASSHSSLRDSFTTVAPQMGGEIRSHGVPPQATMIQTRSWSYVRKSQVREAKGRRKKQAKQGPYLFILFCRFISHIKNNNMYVGLLQVDQVELLAISVRLCLFWTTPLAGMENPFQTEFLVTFWATFQWWMKPEAKVGRAIYVNFLYCKIG